MPTPSNAAPATATPGDPGEFVAQSGDPVDVPGRVLGQRHRPTG